MTSHHWKKDKDGAESCAREGCTVRRRPFRRGSDRYEWQNMRRSLWRHEAHRPIPPCTGKDVGLSAPSPLEVVQKVDDDLATAWLWALERGGPDMARRFEASRAILATLEESIRADERNACAQLADDVAAACDVISSDVMQTYECKTIYARARDAALDVRDAIRNRK